MRRLLRLRFLRSRYGGVLVETAVIMPFLVFVMLGGVELARFALLQQKLNRAAVSMADLVAQAENLTVSEVDQLFTAVEFVISPFQMGPNGLVILTSVSADQSNPPEVDWQRAGAGSASAASTIGVAGGPATLPDGFLVRAGESVIFAEVIYDFEPLLFPQVLPAQRLQHRTMFRPRFGSLSSLQAG